MKQSKGYVTRRDQKQIEGKSESAKGSKNFHRPHVIPVYHATISF